MKGRSLLVFAIMTMGILVSAYGRMPQESIKAAKATLENAKNAQADIYMAYEYKAFEDSLNVMMQKIEAENSKMMKNYGDLKLQLKEPAVRAEKVTAAVRLRKEVVKTQAQAMADAVKDNLSVTRALLSRGRLC